MLQPNASIKRTRIACLRCRNKKVKCDGVGPVCGSCRTKGTRCEFMPLGDKRKPISKEYVETLKQRISTLETQLKNSQNHSFTKNSTTASILSTNSYKASLPKIKVAEDGQKRVYGSRSNISTVQAFDLGIRSNNIYDLRAKSHHVANMLKKDYEISLELRNQLLDHYWTWQNNALPIVLKEKFLQELNEFGTEKSKFCTSSLLSAMLAIGARYSDRPEVRVNKEDPNSAGVKYANHSKILLIFEREIPTIATVQTTALLSLHSLSLDLEALAWDYCGTSVRMALTLGLNLSTSDPVAKGLISEEDSKWMALVWTGCALLETCFNNVLGRSFATNSSYNLGDANISDQILDDYSIWKSPLEPNVLDGEYSRLNTGLILTSKINSVTSSTFDKIYSSCSDLSKDEISILLNKTHLELTEVKVNLPSYWKLPRAITVPCLPHIYMFHLKINWFYIILHKPFFAKDQIHMDHCFLAAQNIVRVCRDFNHHYGIRYLDIIAADILLSAAIIHLRVFSSMRKDSHDSAKRYLSASLLFLKIISQTNSWAKRALLLLKELSIQEGDSLELNKLFKWIEAEKLGKARINTGIISEQINNEFLIANDDDIIKFLNNLDDCITLDN